MPRQLNRVCVYCASSRRIDQVFLDAAARLGALLAARNITVVYGGSSLGSMGALADGAMQAGGRVIGVMPRFMYDLEWAHGGLTELRLVDDMAQRKSALIDEVDGIVALPGGIGTFEELMEALALKSLGLHSHPIVLVNLQGYYEPLIAMFAQAVERRFMTPGHLELFSVVDRVDTVIDALATSNSTDSGSSRTASSS
jgi:uncharacterized protein (TIGR00730 family)